MRKIIGKKMSIDVFRIVETDKFDVTHLLDVFEGKIAGYIHRSGIDSSVCSTIASNFWNSVYLRQRTDGVPGSFLGAYHYQKKLTDYLNEAQYFNAILSGVFSKTKNVFHAVLDELQLALKRNQKILRPARHGQQEACHFFMRSWFGCEEENYALAPHDDESQCTDKRQTGFEIQTTIDCPIVAANFCIENFGGGNLHYWNVQPDNQSKMMLGVEETGYPYPVELLHEFDMIDLKINAGDIYFFNGKNIHAVSSPKTKKSHRTTISCLMGSNTNKDIIYWT